MSLSQQPSPFEPDRLYRTNHPALKSLASVKTIAMWRCYGKGPPYIRSESRILSTAGTTSTARSNPTSNLLILSLLRPSNPRTSTAPTIPISPSSPP